MKNLIQIYFLNQQVKIYKFRLKIRKLITFIRKLFQWVIFFVKLLLSPRKLFRYIQDFANAFNPVSLMLVFKRINFKIAMIVAVLFIMVSGGGWVMGEKFNEKRVVEAEAAAAGEAYDPCNSGLGDYFGCNAMSGEEGSQGGVLPVLIETINRYLGMINTNDPDLYGEQQTQGVLGVMADYLALTYEKPISSERYVTYVADSAGFVTPVHAQSRGLEVISPILPLWQFFRDTALAFIAIIVAIIGFMVLLGQKTGQMSVSISSAIPRVLVAVLLVLFSYPIVGLLVDMAEVGNYFIYDRLNNVSQYQDTSTKLRARVVEDKEILDPTGDLEDDEGNVANIFSLMQSLNRTEQVQKSVGTILDKILGTIITSGVSLGGFDAPVAGLIKIVFGLALISAIFKTFFGLLSAYVGIIIKTIVSPFQLVLTALPSGGDVIGWIKGLLADILVFPATFALLVIAAILMGSLLKNDGVWNIEEDLYTCEGGGGKIVEVAGVEKCVKEEWFPMPLGKFVDSSGESSSGDMVTGFISFGILLFLPSVPGLVKGALKTQDATGGATQQVTGSLKGIASKIPVIGGFVR